MADGLIGLPAEIHSDETILKSILRKEVSFISGLSDRHLNGYGTNAFPHYWSAVYRKAGTRHSAEFSFEQSAQIWISVCSIFFEQMKSSKLNHKMIGRPWPRTFNRSAPGIAAKLIYSYFALYNSCTKRGYHILHVIALNA